jgi:hypothetical protein
MRTPLDVADDFTPASLRALGYSELTEASLDLIGRCATEVVKHCVEQEVLKRGDARELIEGFDEAYESNDDRMALMRLSDGFPDFREVVRYHIARIREILAGIP